MSRLLDDADPWFTCPFCGGRFAVALDVGGILHTRPTCHAFDALEPDEYVAAVNQRIIAIGINATAGPGPRGNT